MPFTHEDATVAAMQAIAAGHGVSLTEPTEPAAADDAALDGASARRVTTALRREQAACDDRPLAHLWDGLAGRIDRLYPAP